MYNISFILVALWRKKEAHFPLGMFYLNENIKIKSLFLLVQYVDTPSTS